MSTVAEFFANKLQNLETYCIINLQDEKYKSFCQEVKKWQKTSIHDFICFFHSVVKPIGVELFIRQLLERHKLKKEDFAVEHYTKLCAYTECFVTLINLPSK